MTMTGIVVQLRPTVHYSAAEVAAVGSEEMAVHGRSNQRPVGSVGDLLRQAQRGIGSRT